MDTGTTLILTWVIIAVIAVLTIYALMSQRTGVAHNAPSILTSLGIFGTFLGITIGLAGFDPDDVANSITALFGGIKLAFWTSVAGILGGILVKFKHLFMFTEPSESASLEDLISTMRGIENGLLDQLKAMGQAAGGGLEGLQAATAEQAESMRESLQYVADAMKSDAGQLLSQLKDMDATTAENLNKLLKSTESVGADLGSELSKLSEQLSQQLGDELGDRLSSSAQKSAETTAAQIKSVAGQLLSQFKDMDATTAENLNKLLKSTESVGADLGSELSKLSEQLSQQLGDELGDRLSSSAQKSAETTAAQIKSVAEAMQGLREAMGEDTGAVLERLEKVRAGSDDLGQRLAEVLGEGNTGLVEAITRLQDVMRGDTAGMIERMDNLRQGADTLGDRLTEVLGESNAALKRAMEDNRDKLGAQIATAVTDIRDALVGPDGAARMLSGELGEALQKGQMNLAKALARTTETLQEAVSEDAAAMLARLESVGSGLEAMGDNLSGSLNEMTDNLRGAFGDMGGDLSGDVKQMATTMADAIDDLRLAIVGPEGARDGILEEMRTARAQTQQNLQDIHEALKENTKRQVDYSPKGLMIVLEDLIKQFNTQFAGQFWEKIGGFNQGIGELMEWMETYRKQLDDMVRQQGESAQHMSTATRRFDEIASKSEIFIDVSRNISNLLGGIDGQRVQIENHLKRFAHIVDETADSLESIEERIVAGNHEMNKHLSEIAERIEAQVIRVDRAMDEELTKSLITFGQQLSALSEKFVEDYTPLTERLREVVNISRGA